MKNSLYYEDAYIKSFTAEVLHTGEDERGFYVVLANTAFYPTGGGQPHDTGTIAQLAVQQVEKIDEEIRHYLSEPAQLTGHVTAEIDWVRRFDHMQQHTGQHILSAAFVELFDLATVSFHLGSELVTIDLATPAVTEEQLALAEQRANEIIIENRPIETKWVTKDELTQYPIRKDIAVDGDIRLVIIPNYDYNGCGGTHPASTGAVQAIKLLETEKMKGGTRLHFVCGQRVLQQLAIRKTVLSNVARQLSVPEQEAGQAVAKLMETAKHTDKLLAEARENLLHFEASQLVATGETIISHVLEGRSMQELQKLARFITLQNEHAIALLVTVNDDKLQFVAARGAKVERSMKAVAAAALPLIHGKGGGSDALVQGGGAKEVAAASLLNAMQQAL